jgi:UDP-glucose 4-epimerase
MLDEFLALAHWTETRLPVVIARLFNTVGPRQTGRYGMVIPRFVAQALANESITVYGDGSQSRAFAHVSDVVGILVGLMKHPAASGQVYNVGNDSEISILNLAKRIKERAGSASEIRLVPYSEAYPAGFEDLQRRVPDLTKLRYLLENPPVSSLDRILDDVIAERRAATSRDT